MTSTAVAAELPVFSDRILACLKTPGADNDGLTIDGDVLVCSSTGERFPFHEGVPALFFETGAHGRNVTQRVRAYYEENPFPSYKGLEEFGELVSKGLSNPFSRNLLDAIGYNKLVLDCGCGTGQLSHFLQLNNNHVLGIDMSISSLQRAMEHKRHNQLVRCGFCQMNIFDLAIEDESFDVVISHGVLHHTFDARRAFASIVRKAKRGGIVIIGLNNSYARIPTWLRSQATELLGNRIDYAVRNRIHNAQRANVWIKDQYYNPYETWHSIGEVLSWFEENQVEFLNCSPPILGSSTEQARSLFDSCDPGTPYQRAVTQISWFATISRERALFDVIGRRTA